MLEHRKLIINLTSTSTTTFTISKSHIPILSKLQIDKFVQLQSSITHNTTRTMSTNDKAMCFNPKSLYFITVDRMKQFDMYERDVIRLPLPRTIIYDLLPLFAELPPGWYYCPHIEQFVINASEFSEDVQKNICDHWRKNDVEGYHFAIKLCIYWKPFCPEPVDEDDHIDIYMNEDLLQFHLSQIFNRFENRMLPWIHNVSELCDVIHLTTTKYMKVSNNFQPPQWLRLVKFPSKFS